MRRVPATCQIRSSKVVTIDVAKRRKLLFNVDPWRKTRLEVRTRHHARQCSSSAFSDNEIEHRKPIFDKRNAEQRDPGFELMRDAVTRENIFDHFAVGLDM